MLDVYIAGPSGAAVPDLCCFPQTQIIFGDSLFFFLAVVLLVV